MQKGGGGERKEERGEEEEVSSQKSKRKKRKMSANPTEDERTQVLNAYKAKVLEHREMESRCVFHMMKERSKKN